MWHYTATYAPAGDIGKWEDSAIADALGWPAQECARLMHALRISRWVDAHDVHRLVVHDWYDHCEDAVHMALARKTQYFVDGRMPKLTKFNDKEKAIIRELYAKTPYILTDMRTECAQNAQECAEKRTALALPSPPIAIANSLDPPIVPHSGDGECSATASRKRTPKRNGTLTQEQQAWFDEFWSRYPRKKDKGAALKAWAKLHVDAETWAAMLATFEWQIPEMQRKDISYVKYPATYLNARGWESEPDKNTFAKSAGVFVDPNDSEIPF